MRAEAINNSPALLRPFLSGLADRLSRSGVSNAGQEAAWLLRHALNLSSADLLAHPERPLTPEETQALELLIRRREAGEPLQYILGEAPFYGRDFHVGPGVLIPRQDTGTLVDAALSLFPSGRPFTFLDWGTGSGCIAVTLLLERPGSFALMADRSPAALEYARANLSRYHVGKRARLFLSESPEDIGPSVCHGCGLVISNPPYIPTDAIDGLMREVRDHEPRLALDGGPDGMDYYRALFKYSPGWLEPGGFLILEAGDAYQAGALRLLFEARKENPEDGSTGKENFKFLRGLEDASGTPRCLVWRYFSDGPEGAFKDV